MLHMFFDRPGLEPIQLHDQYKKGERNRRGHQIQLS
jgi:hypothetical protein